MSKVLIVYYSRGGKTGSAVQELAKSIDCDVEALVDKRNRKGIIGYILAGRDAMSKKLTALQPVKYNSSEYDKVVLCTPTWASDMVPAIRTYIEEHKQEFKQVAFLVTQAGQNNGKVYKNLEEAVGKTPICKTNISGAEFKEGSWKEIISGFAKEINK